MQRVAIEIRGGCFVSAWAANDDIEVEIWDWDNIRAEAEENVGKAHPEKISAYMELSEKEFRESMKEDKMVEIA